MNDPADLSPDARPAPAQRIVILAHNLRVAGGLSVGINIIGEFFRLAPRHTYRVYVPAGCEYETKAVPPDRADEVCAVPAMSLPQRLRFDKSRLPGEVAAFKPDWVIGLGNMGLTRPPCRQAILFQDSHLIYPTKHYAMESRAYRFKKRMVRLGLAQCLKRTDVVFTQTQTTRRRFAESFGFPQERIHLLPNAVSKFAVSDQTPRTPDPLQPYHDRFKLFALTKCYGHKNLDRVLEAYSRYRDELADTLCVWTIAADQHPIAPGMLDRIEREGLGELILNVGPLRQEQLPGYFGACDAVLMPTLLESFSGTYLEAMYHQRPILTSDLDFAHEVCGDAALFVDPWRVETIKDGIKRLRDDHGLRERLIDSGKARMSTFFRSWEDIVSSALDVLGIL